MQRFVELCAQADRSRRPGERLDALSRYFRAAPAADAAWAVHVLARRGVVPPVSLLQTRGWVCQVLGLPRWLVAECRRPRRDPLETLALLLCGQRGVALDVSLDELVRAHLAPAVRGDASGVAAMRWVRDQLSGPQAYVALALLTGTPPLRVPRAMLLRAIVESSGRRCAPESAITAGRRCATSTAEGGCATSEYEASAGGLDPATVAYRLDTGWSPERRRFEDLCAPRVPAEKIPAPPRFPRLTTVTPDDSRVATGDVLCGVWQPEGTRTQLGRQQGVGWVWTATGRFVQRDFAELAAAAEWLPEGVVLEGAIVRAARRQAGGAHGGPEHSAGQMRLFSPEPVRFVVVDLLAGWDGGGVQPGAAAVQAWPQRADSTVQAWPQRADSTVQAWPQRADATVQAWPQRADATVGGGAQPGAASAHTAPAAGTQPGAAVLHQPGERRRALVALLAAPGAPRCLQLADDVVLTQSAALNDLAAPAVRNSARGVRVVGHEWLVVPQPRCIRAVLMSARRGRRRSYSRLEVGVWCNQQLSPVGLCRSALPGAEQEIVDHFVRESGRRHGPAAVVPPRIVCDVSFEKVVRSRRRVGLSLVRPHVVRIVRDVPAGSAADRGELERMLEG